MNGFLVSMTYLRDQNVGTLITLLRCMSLILLVAMNIIWHKKHVVVPRWNETEQLCSG